MSFISSSSGTLLGRNGHGKYRPGSKWRRLGADRTQDPIRQHTESAPHPLPEGNCFTLLHLFLHPLTRERFFVGIHLQWKRFHSLAPMYYRGSAAAVIVYDITKQDSFHTLKKWVKELKEHGPENIVMAIAGNKCDLSDIREVPLKDAKEYAESIGAVVVETSAKNAINIEELFQGIKWGIADLYAPQSSVPETNVPGRKDTVKVVRVKAL
ncbi:ras-related protein Rab-31 isoform X1 [Felis catus]|uniref:ras-related protein Rab-31 isoform X1 n=1 Tax=Felis catus TaxID=9685 RepID=UPI0012348592|nr:ras-related protein Rab-31 isoform X1 [Felis catus]XP_044898333.1 ras-related protein Rab-31 isoform X1 [Felis catus]